ncbi:F14 [Felid gammaherpesvirus 1]|uniref:F14 n=1 Tax=Felid gammaherpesvirus 1 TaxID=2560468 RepID=A0A0M4MD91_9GAMA|nr:F14 [Felis catus gammaherpesvirus 1]ALE14725.1 F14 [Felis catus gammaherpesvirus 1]
MLFQSFLKLERTKEDTEAIIQEDTGPGKARHELWFTPYPFFMFVLFLMSVMLFLYGFMIYEKAYNTPSWVLRRIYIQSDNVNWTCFKKPWFLSQTNQTVVNINFTQLLNNTNLSMCFLLRMYTEGSPQKKYFCTKVT